MLKRTKLLTVLATLFACGAIASAGTIMTFEDPALDGSTELFTIDQLTSQISGGWSDAAGGLNLNLENVTGVGQTFNDAWFEMDTLAFQQTSPFSFEAAGGEIRFYEDGASNQLDPLVSVKFDRAFFWSGGFGAETGIFRSDNVVITVKYLGQTYVYDGTDASFGFGFSNQKLIDPQNPGAGFTATAAFTSTGIPEPAMIGFLAAGVGIVARRRKA